MDCFEIITGAFSILSSIATAGAFIKLIKKDKDKEKQLNALVGLSLKQDAQIGELKKQAEAMVGIHTIEKKRERDRIRPILGVAQTLHMGAAARVQATIRLKNIGTGNALEVIAKLAIDNSRIRVEHNEIKKLTPDDIFTIYVHDNRPEHEKYHNIAVDRKMGQISFIISVFYMDEIGTQYRADVNSNTLEIKTERL